MPVEQRRQLRHERDLAAQLQRVELARVGSAEPDHALSGSESRSSSRSIVDLPEPEGPTTALTPSGSRDESPFRTGSPPRRSETRSSSNSIGGIIACAVLQLRLRAASA